MFSEKDVDDDKVPVSHLIQLVQVVICDGEKPGGSLQGVRTAWLWKTNTQIQIHKYKYIDITSTKIQIHKYKYKYHLQQSAWASASENNLDAKLRVPSIRAPRESLAGKHFPWGEAPLFWFLQHFKTVTSLSKILIEIMILIPVEPKYIFENSRRSVEEELSCSQRIIIAQCKDIRWNRTKNWWKN